MTWAAYFSWFLGGAFLANAVPHFVNGVSGSPFQSPFSKPPGKGLSSATVNVLWGAVNAAISFLLITRVGAFNFHSARHMLVAGLGGLVMALLLARSFGRFHGGNISASEGAHREA